MSTRVIPSLGPPYRATAWGSVLGNRGRIYQYRDPRGYIYVKARGRNWPLHRLVCEAWHGPPPSPDYHVDHIDNNRHNNWPSNLRWCEPKVNCAKITPPPTPPCPDMVEALYRDGIPINQIALLTGKTRSSIQRTLRRRNLR